MYTKLQYIVFLSTFASEFESYKYKHSLHYTLSISKFTTMEHFRFIFLSSFLYVILLVGVFASEDVSWETYWQSALPKTPIPQAVQELLHPENWPGTEGKSTYTGISKDALNINTIQSGSAFPTAGPESYAKAATGKIPVEQGVTTFFFEKDLHLGKKMTLHFPKTTNNANLLPRLMARAQPFSSSKLPEILNRFSLKPESAEAEIVKQTIEECEEPSIEGEDKYCATSLESLVDFSVSKLGKYAEVFSTKVDVENKQEYRIARRVEKVGERSVVCHKQKYVYAVFYCHEIRSTRAYKVSLVGADGTKAEAVAVCHTDTRKWNIKLLAFQLLKIKPGTVPVCHFLPSGNLLWVPN